MLRTTNQALGLAGLAFAVMARAQTPVETVLHNFLAPPQGRTPYWGLFRDAAGNLYGTTIEGGPANAGTVFKVNTSGEFSVLYQFKGGADGAYPNAGVIADSEGNLYGTTTSGGASNVGTVFELSAAGEEKVLYSFTGGADGSSPYSGVIRDSQGNLYGTTILGGATYGVVYKLDPTGHETVLYAFQGLDGIEPYGGVIRDSAGNLYGTTFYGGSDIEGVVYKVTPSGTETVLHNFTGGADGGQPYSGLIADSAGNLYGTTAFGGTSGAGTVFKVDKSGTESVLYSFTGGPDGGEPYAALFRATSGVLYGTTTSGGGANSGVVFKVDGTGTESVLYTFTGGPDGAQPYGSVTPDSAGNLYGTAAYGGAGNGFMGLGTVYKLQSDGHLTVLFLFPASAGGTNPVSGVITSQSCNGNLYGTTREGGPNNEGVVYELHPNGKETVLYSFTGGPDGGEPNPGLILNSACDVYGTTYAGGAFGSGVAFTVNANGQETVLYSFMGGNDGANPEAGLISDSSGNFYGTTYYGGIEDSGVVFKLAAGGVETVLYRFMGASDGGHPAAGVIRDSEGNLYGTATNGGTSFSGVVFEVSAAGAEKVLYNFTGSNDGGFPAAGVTRVSGGTLYGTANGGAHFAGVVYKLTPSGEETPLYSFTGGPDGGFPSSGVILDSSGNLYGTATGGGTGYGVVYEVSATGVETVWHTFTGGADGAIPEGGVIRDAAGNLYGTAGIGGTESSGVVYKLSPQ